MSEAMTGGVGGDPELRRAVAAIRRHWRRRRILEGAPAIVAAAIVALLVGLALRSALGSPGAIITATRIVGYLLLATAAVWFMVLPAFRRIDDEQIALYVEEQAPYLRQLFLSAVHQLREPVAPGASRALQHGIVRRALDEIGRLEDGAVIERPKARRAVARLAALGVAGALLVALGPAAVRDIARVLFVPWSRAAAATLPALSVSPGDVSVPRGAALDVRAELRAAMDRGAEIVIRADSADTWTRVAMVHDSTGAGYVARLFDINRNTTYYIEAAGLRSPEYRITVTDLPTVRQLALELRYPAYTALPPQRIENGGDVVAVTGTTAALDITATLPVTGGALHFDDGTNVPLTLRDDGHLTGTFKVAHDGFYRVDLVASDGTRVPGTVQHSVEALVDHPPVIRIEKPGRDTRVTSIEEVPISVRASDDYGVRRVELHYTVNGGSDHVVTLADSTHKASIDFSAVHTLFLEELSLHVGDLVAYHAIARDGAGNAASSDIYFMEVRAFGKDYHAADDNGGGGGGGGGGGNNPGKFTERQRQLVAGTFNWQRDSARTSDRDRRANATTLAIAQGKLRIDVAAQSAQMLARGAEREDSVFKLVIAELDSAAKEMKPAEDGLGRHVMSDAIPAEERALQHLQAADEAYRDITVRQQQGGGGGGGGGGGSAPQDLADLFELQTDKLKNQYEAPRADASSPVQQALDSTAEKLKELAARQLQENERQRQAADALAQRLAQQSGGSGGGSGGQQGGQQGQQGRGQQGGQTGSQRPGTQQLSRQPTGSGPTGSAQRDLARQVEEQARQLEKLSREQNSPELADAARKLQEAADAMRQAAAGSQQQGTTALDRLRQAAQNVTGAQSSAQGQAIQDLARRANDLGAQQRSIANDVAGLQGGSPADKEQRASALDQRKDALAAGVKQLGTDAQRVAQEVRRDQPKAAAAAQTAADEIRNRQVAEQIGQSKRIMRDNMPEYSRILENLIGETLDSVAQRLASAAGSVGTGRNQQQAVALDRTRELVRDLQSLRDRTTGALVDSLQAGQVGQQAGQTGQSGQQSQPGQPAQSGQPGPPGRGQQPAQGQQGQRGQQGQSQPGQPGQGQSGQGQQPGQGQRGQPGQQPGQGQGQGGQPGQNQGQPQRGRGGGQNRGTPPGGSPAGGSGIPNDVRGIGDSRQFQREVAARATAAEALRRELAAQGVDVAPLDQTIGQLKQLQQTTNPGKADELQAAIVAGLKEFEFSVWRKFNGADLANKPALGSSAQVPPEYRAMVEQYYRALARKGPN